MPAESAEALRTKWSSRREEAIWEGGGGGGGWLRGGGGGGWVQDISMWLICEPETSECKGSLLAEPATASRGHQGWRAPLCPGGGGGGVLYDGIWLVRGSKTSDNHGDIHAKLAIASRDLHQVVIKAGGGSRQGKGSRGRSGGRCSMLAYD